MVSTLLGTIFNVFTEVFVAIRSWLGMAMAVFWTSNNGLTFFGVMSLVALGMSIFLLLIRVVQNFLHFRG